MKKKSKVSKKSSARLSAPKSAFKVQPLGDRVVVKPEEALDERSPSGIIIPDTARKEKPERGTVVAVGEGKRNDRGDVLSMRIKTGDTVVFSKYGYDEVKIDDQDYYIVSEGNILAIIQ
jgi:chaperonin GroES